MKDELNASNSQIHILLSDKKELEDILDKQVHDKDRLMEDLNTSFKENVSLLWKNFQFRGHDYSSFGLINTLKKLLSQPLVVICYVTTQMYF